MIQRILGKFLDLSLTLSLCSMQPIKAISDIMQNFDKPMCLNIDTFRSGFDKRFIGKYLSGRAALSYDYIAVDRPSKYFVCIKLF